MALRVLTGIIVPSEADGDVTINFNPHSVTGTDGRGIEMSVQGAAGAFSRIPAKVVALRQMNEGSGSVFQSQGTSFKIDDSSFTTNHLVVSWRSPTKMQIREISYLIIGEVDG